MLIIIIGTWVEETNRLILELDSRSGTEIIFQQWNKDTNYTMKSLILAQDER